MDILDVAMIQGDRLKTGEVSSELSSLRRADESKLREATKDFEALFVKIMLDSMRKTVHKSGLMDGGYAETIYEDMLYEKYSEKIASTARLGIAETLYNQMSAYLS